ncbi:2TM domain-containing protein [Flavobacterium subsaxonicum]|uniref:Histidine kinase n=1 Tax=Flavobacterium subsaxonicum WB 4.1-42 = DSM 21790 TaxID=1121898 RepID=A0A0A2MXM6_9FLAO|nr:2TM domain-containing protein [Flavobacterium subsaxonicum]KGO92980.1 histidine kinase [Flavobacterium subsaxonicum WB 4.1-42 = DSM 21790]
MENSFEDERRIEKARKKIQAIKGFYKHFAAYVIVNIVLIVMHWVDMEPGEHFLEWNTFSTAFFWGIGLLLHAFGVFGTDVFLGADWEERKIREYMDKDTGKKNKWE